MTIATDIDAAIEAEETKRKHGKRPKPQTLRCGPAAIAALCACHEHLTMEGDQPVAYRGIPIEPVPPPEHPFNAGTSDRFAGWELRC